MSIIDKTKEYLAYVESQASYKEKDEAYKALVEAHDLFKVIHDELDQTYDGESYDTKVVHWCHRKIAAWLEKVNSNEQ